MLTDKEKEFLKMLFKIGYIIMDNSGGYFNFDNNNICETFDKNDFYQLLDKLNIDSIDII